MELVVLLFGNRASSDSSNERKAGFEMLCKYKREISQTVALKTALMFFYLCRHFQVVTGFCCRVAKD